MRVPSSYDRLPKPRLPAKRRTDEVAALQRSIIKEVGLSPGCYTSLVQGNVFGQVEGVYHQLTDHLLTAISGLDAVELCRRLYEWQEVLIGNVQKLKYQSIPQISLFGSMKPTEQRLLTWQGITPWTESIRWLIEIAVKYCMSPGERPGNAKLEYLIELARAAFEWDAIWENIAHGLVPYEVTIHLDSSVAFSPTARGLKARDAFLETLKRYQFSIDREWADNNLMTEQEVSLEEAVELPEFKVLDEPLERVRGYRMTDWLRFCWELIDSFGPTQYIKITGLSKMSNKMAIRWGIPQRRFANLLTDFALSKEALSDFSVRKIPPMEFYRRDTRLLRRPVILLPLRDKHICLYGVEVASAGTKLFVNELTKGKIKFSLIRENGHLSRAIGKIQSNSGNSFRDMIAEECLGNGFQIQKEKDRAQSEMIPQTGFGPVDVFVIDRKFHRFLLVEVKDTSDSGSVPKLMKNERNKYLSDVEKLNRQTKWFADRVELLKTEYDIDPVSKYSVVGVIVINKPRLWMFANDTPLPVVDDRAFFRALKRGKCFMTVPEPAQ